VRTQREVAKWGRKGREYNILYIYTVGGQWGGVGGPLRLLS